MSASEAGIQVQVTRDAIDAGGLQRKIGRPGHGAQVFFYGVVRDSNRGRKVRAVSYDAHPALTTGVLREICREARERWEGLEALIFHRIGRLEIGEISVAIATSLPHRDEAYQASRYVIEELKKRAPIWKKEHYVDGDSEWLPGHSLCEHGHG